MSDLCTISDVEALLGYPIPAEQTPRVNTLIGMASSVVGGYVGEPEPVPDAVAYVTASLVVRTLANPGQLSSEAIGTYRAAYPAGMALTDQDKAALEPWMPFVPGERTWNACVPAELPGCGEAVFVTPPFDWERDLDRDADLDLGEEMLR